MANTLRSRIKRKKESLSVLLPDGGCAIAIDPWKMNTVAEETVCLAHELGHCETGSFYSPHTAFELRERMENRADKWAIRTLIPKSDLTAALRGGCTELWELAERFARVSGYRLEDTPYNSSFAGYKDWFIQSYRRPGFTVEVGTGENPLPLGQFGEIYAASLPILLEGATG